jgi:Flp pilus assembly protein TadD
MIRYVVGFLAAVGLLLAQGNPLEQSRLQYQHTDYKAVVRILQPVEPKTGAMYELLGQAYMMTGEFKKAVEVFEKAVALEPGNGEYAHWLGRAWGRLAEISSPFTAPRHAVRARQNFEKAVQLDPNNKEALNDLFDYYLNAPGFLGGGFNKAEELVNRIAALDPAEGHYARAQLADSRKDFNTAEQQLRRAYELAPRQIGRILDLATYLSKRGRVQESDQVFEQAVKLAPNSPRVLFARAETYVKQKRNLTEAKSLLQKYLKSELTPDDPPREQALELLKSAGGV